MGPWNVITLISDYINRLSQYKWVEVSLDWEFAQSRLPTPVDVLRCQFHQCFLSAFFVRKRVFGANISYESYILGLKCLAPKFRTKNAWVKRWWNWHQVVAFLRDKTSINVKGQTSLNDDKTSDIQVSISSTFYLHLFHMSVLWSFFLLQFGFCNFSAKEYVLEQILLVNVWWNWLQVSISPVFYKQLFCTKSVFLSFLFVIFCQKEICSLNGGEIDCRNFSWHAKLVTSVVSHNCWTQGTFFTQFNFSGSNLWKTD